MSGKLSKFPGVAVSIAQNAEPVPGLNFICRLTKNVPVAFNFFAVPVAIKLQNFSVRAKLCSVRLSWKNRY